MAARAFARVAPVRAKAAFYIILGLGLFLTWRLFDVQIRQGPRLAREALAQRSEIVDLFAKRGAIFDRDGAVLARSLPSESVYAVPASIVDPRTTAAVLAPLLGERPDALEPVLREHSQFRWLARKVPYEISQRIKALAIVGIYTEPEETGVRFTPSGHLASTVLGFVGVDENGWVSARQSRPHAHRSRPVRPRDPVRRAGDSREAASRPGARAHARFVFAIRGRTGADGARRRIARAQRHRDHHGSRHGRGAGPRERAGLRPGALREVLGRCAA